MSDNRNFIVERYLDQVKIITALATTLLITPNLFLDIIEKGEIRARLDASLSYWKTLLLFTNIMFIVSILSTYVIYSSIVGSLINKKNEDHTIYRNATRITSFIQFGSLIIGCIGLLILFQYSI